MPMTPETGPAQRGHPVFASLYDPLTRGWERRRLAPERAQLIARCQGRVLELGAGTGASFPHWTAARRAGSLTELVAIEPDPHMRRRAAARARTLRLPVDLLAAPAEDLPLPDASFDCVAAFLVLCTVADPAQALAEAYRVLRPGGTLAFLEHVRADGAAASWQRRIRPLWARLGAGCQLDRDTGAAIARAGFADMRLRTLPLPFPLCRLVAGTARRP